jgi:hypothetical protein
VTDLPVGPWVLVVGMHRSGTSAVTGALGALGLALPVAEDRMAWAESNPEHWESLSLSLFDEELLNRQGGSWDGPPESIDAWPDLEQVRLEMQPEVAASAAFPPSGPVAWKDPRVCLLLPYWRSVLPSPLAALFVWRAPLAVAHSLRQRDGMPTLEGLALWERYNRTALEGLEGVDTLVVQYESLIEDAGAFVHSLSSWLGTLGQFADSVEGSDVDGAASSIITGLRHQREQSEDDEAALVSTQQHELVRQLTALIGAHRPLGPVVLSAETPETAAVISFRRRLAEVTRGKDALQEELQATRSQLAQVSAALGNTERELDDTKRGLADTKRGLADTKRGLDYTKRGLDYTTRELDQTKLALSEAAQKLAELHASTSWRITKPLRTSVSKLDKLGYRPTRR